ncbi:uncharacterized protein RMCC_0811 [Mycolicibacterium canariasense]|uniref:DUF4267 domain-containing protein n=1 Tax=Mycolicibacterium canariasense TaxID=228230 RepID=A0A117I8X5_MYCCR|nr:hypothetical protein [Mycolicibacterium canariasense]MCV7212873.1 hypothetical protein [Mycolicibacterium canariasense]ORV19275.1 hypothetical protein AWB94_32460 [Mycolicibacterium canariasense]GAS93845.1 uncharacterized protein RMCC_0811 [Mycolicibacterium canariasense]
MINSVRMSTLIGIARAAIGVAYMIAPTRAHTTLAGRDAALPTTRAASRTFGIREIYVGGSVVAAQAWSPRAVVPLLVAGVVIDAWDTAAFATTADLPDGMRRAGVAVAGVFTVGGIAAAIQTARTRRGGGRTLGEVRR